MTEPNGGAPAQGDPGNTDPNEPNPAGDGGDTTDWKVEARKWEERAKANAAAAKEAEKLRRQAMTADERAIAEAEQRGRAAATAETGRELARERFDALAGRRNPDVNTAEILELVDLGRFVGDDGRPDQKVIEAAVKRLVPEAVGGTPLFDGGARGGPPAKGDMNQIIRRAAGVA